MAPMNDGDSVSGRGPHPAADKVVDRAAAHCDNVRLLPDAEATARLGAAIARGLRPGEAVCLSGPLGAGKSTLARGLVRALTTPDQEAPSPTFTLVQTYPGRDFEIAHFDLYRLTRAEEAFELGLEEALAEGVAIIEWPERLDGALPVDRLEVEIAFSDQSDAGGETGREVRMRAFGAWRGRELDV
jgi:tRNA threonylcarbamoyladenosine biosynthesis protein TsaE